MWYQSKCKTLEDTRVQIISLHREKRCFNKNTKLHLQDTLCCFLVGKCVLQFQLENSQMYLEDGRMWTGFYEHSAYGPNALFMLSQSAQMFYLTYCVISVRISPILTYPELSRCSRLPMEPYGQIIKL